MMEEKKKWKTARILCGIMALLLVIAIPISIMIRDGYGQQEKWACLPQTIDKEVDVFFIAPTVYFGDDTHFNLSLKDEETKTKFVGAIQMEKGIYDESCNFYAPFYRQAALNVYTMPLEQQSKYMDLAYKDVKKAFHYYLKHYNTDRPFIIAGFSQGAQMSLRLLEDYFAEEEYQNRLIAAYVIGGAVTEEDLINYPHLKMAEGEADTGCIISFNSEAEHTTTSLIVPTATLGINPLNWKTDSTPAEADLNQGACFTGYDGEIKEEIPYLCGAYLDEKRGTLKITGIEESDYPPGLDMFDPGVYHIYDYQFFYRNLQKNVALRVKQYQTLQALKNRNKEAKATVETDLSIETKPEVGNMAVNVTSAMMDEAYWLDLCQNKEELVMSIQDVQIFNENHTSAVSKFGYTYYAQGVEKEIISRDELLSLLNQNTSYQNDRFLNGKEVEPEFYEELVNKIGKESVKEENAIQYGFSIRRGAVRSLPTDIALYDDPDVSLFDELQNSSILLNEPIIIVYTIPDKSWSYILTNYCSGWVKTEDIAVCRNYDEWRDLQEKPFLVVTENKFCLDEDSSNPHVSNLELTMGDKLMLVDSKDPGVTKDGRIPYDTYEVYIPVRGFCGKIEFEKAFIPAYHSVSEGYLPYTREHVIELAFASHGERYGWGGMFNARDCSQYIMELYRCFGLQFARNTGGQMAMQCKTLYIDGLSDAAKKEIISAIPAGSCLYFPGHAMIYLGEVDGNLYVISAVGTMNPDGTHDGEVKSIHTVSINDLSVRRRNGKTWLESLTVIKVIENE